MDFDSLNFENLQDILGSMSQSDMENLASLASNLFSNGDNSQGAQQSEKQSAFDGLDFESISRIVGVINKLNSQPKDPGCELISALKPMLSTKRQKKADEAISMLRLISLLPLIGEVMN